VEYV